MKKACLPFVFIAIFALFIIRPGNSGVAVNVNSTFYFQTDNGTHGLELWKTNGTEAGTVMVKDINPGSDWSYHYSSEGDFPSYDDYD